MHYLFKNQNQNASVKGRTRPAQHGTCPHPHGRASGGANTGLCWYCCSRIGRGRLGRGPGRKTRYQVTLKGSFVSGKAAVSTRHPHPPLTPAVPGIPPPPAVRASFLPRRASGLEVGGGGEGGTGWEGMSSSLPKGCHSFQMSFPEA